MTMTRDEKPVLTRELDTATGSEKFEIACLHGLIGGASQDAIWCEAIRDTLRKEAAEHQAVLDRLGELDAALKAAELRGKVQQERADQQAEWAIREATKSIRIERVAAEVAQLLQDERNSLMDIDRGADWPFAANEAIAKLTALTGSSRG